MLRSSTWQSRKCVEVSHGRCTYQEIKFTSFICCWCISCKICYLLGFANEMIRRSFGTGRGLLRLMRTKPSSSDDESRAIERLKGSLGLTSQDSEVRSMFQAMDYDACMAMYGMV